MRCAGYIGHDTTSGKVGHGLQASDRNSTIKPGASLKRLPHLPQNASPQSGSRERKQPFQDKVLVSHWHYLRMASAFDAADEANSGEQRNNETHRHRPRSDGAVPETKGYLATHCGSGESF